MEKQSGFRTRSEAANAILRADLPYVSARVERRIVYVTEKTKQYNSPIAERLRDKIIYALRENERLCSDICAAFDDLDKIKTIAVVHKTNSDAKKVRSALNKVHALIKTYHTAQERYDQTEKDYLAYVVEQGCLLVTDGID
jgi:hypothetical protein